MKKAFAILFVSIVFIVLISIIVSEVNINANGDTSANIADNTFVSTITTVPTSKPKFDSDVTEPTANTPTTQPENKKSYYNITAEERELLARIVTCEASICSLECQKDVCSVIFNRLESGKWRKDMNNDGVITLYDIIYYPNAFSPTINGAMDKCTKPCASAYEAVDYVVENGPTVPTYVRYFRTSYDFSWDDYTNYKVIDNVYFGYFTTWQQGAW
jgi:spore germination cell wall hydrolase CwlJ-like protein